MPSPPPRTGRAIAAAVLITIGLAAPGGAAELEGVHFPEQRRIDDVDLRLSCVGLLRYKVFIKAYVAGLYLGEGVGAGEAMADVPKRLELSYFWSIDGQDFGKAGDEILARNLGPEALAALRPRLQRINRWYRDVKPGDRYSLTYLPGSGTELALNDDRIGIIEGADFAAAYFRIWLGDNPIDTRLRDQLLSCEGATAGRGPASAPDPRLSGVGGEQVPPGRTAPGS
jgi:hypothetical protein